MTAKRRNDDGCPGSGGYYGYDARVTQRTAKCRNCESVVGLTWNGVMVDHGHTFREVPDGE